MFIYVLSRHLQCLFVNKCAIMIHHVKTWLPITAKVALAVQVPGAFFAVRLRRDQSETGFRFHGSLDYRHFACRAFKTDACGLPFETNKWRMRMTKKWNGFTLSACGLCVLYMYEL